MTLANFYVWLDRDIHRLRKALDSFDDSYEHEDDLITLCSSIEEVIKELKKHLEEMESVA